MKFTISQFFLTLGLALLAACAASPGGVVSVDTAGAVSAPPAATSQTPASVADGSVNAGGPPERPGSPVDLDPGCPICLMLRDGRTPDDLEANWHELYGDDCLAAYRSVYESGETPPLCRAFPADPEAPLLRPRPLAPEEISLDPAFPGFRNFDTLGS